MNSNNKININIHKDRRFLSIYNILYLVYFLSLWVKFFMYFATSCMQHDAKRRETNVHANTILAQWRRTKPMYTCRCTRSIEHSRELTNCGDHCETWFRFAALVYSVTTVADRPLFLIHIFHIQVYEIMYIFDSLNKKN